MKSGLNDKITEASKWSFITEIFEKLAMPISNMILARLLFPEDFGVLATVQMVLSFADMLADAGFQKFIVQRNFVSDREKNDTILVAIYSNIIMGMIIWGTLVFFSEEVATLVGNKGLGAVFVFAGCSIPVLAFSSVQMAVMRRDFQFKEIMNIRLVKAIMPLLITVPLAGLGYGYWSLIIGFVATQVVQSIVVLFVSDVQFRLFYSIRVLRRMMSFAVWTLVESIFIWFTVWCDIFIVSNAMSAYYLGIYRMSMASVQSLFAIVTGAIIPVLYSALSRLQNDEQGYQEVFFRIHKRTALFVIPLGFGVFCYRDLARWILFGQDWREADLMIGLWGVALCVSVVYCYFCSEVYRSKGQPRISTMVQVLHMSCLIPAIYYSSSNFEELVLVRNLVVLQFIISHFVLMHYFMKINPLKMVHNTWLYMAASLVMTLFVIYSRAMINSNLYDWFSMILAIIVYLVVLCMFKEERALLIEIAMSKKVF